MKAENYNGKRLNELTDEELKKVNGGDLSKIIKQFECANRQCHPGEEPSEDCPCRAINDPAAPWN